MEINSKLIYAYYRNKYVFQIFIYSILFKKYMSTLISFSIFKKNI